jgi:hypothetical protein
VAGADQEGTQRLEAGTDDPPGNLLGKGGPGALAADGAGAGVALILGGDGERGRQIDDLMASWRGIVGRGNVRQRSLAVGTALGNEGDEVIDLIKRLQGTEAAFVPGLAAGVVAGRAGRRRTLGSVGGIGGGRARGIAGVAMETRGESGHLLLELGNLILKLGKLAEKGLAARALGVGRAHVESVRERVCRFLPT